MKQPVPMRKPMRKPLVKPEILLSDDVARSFQSQSQQRNPIRKSEKNHFRSASRADAVALNDAMLKLQEMTFHAYAADPAYPADPAADAAAAADAPTSRSCNPNQLMEKAEEFSRETSGENGSGGSMTAEEEAKRVLYRASPITELGRK
jgi:hypothetical protein